MCVREWHIDRDRETQRIWAHSNMYTGYVVMIVIIQMQFILLPHNLQGHSIWSRVPTILELLAFASVLPFFFFFRLSCHKYFLFKTTVGCCHFLSTSPIEIIFVCVKIPCRLGKTTPSPYSALNYLSARADCLSSLADCLSSSGLCESHSHSLRCLLQFLCWSFSVIWLCATP